MVGVVGVEFRAPKTGALSLGSPSFSLSFLKTKELEKYLVVARCKKMWLRMHGVPPISPSARTLRIAQSSQTRFGLCNTNVSSLHGIQFFALGKPVRARFETFPTVPASW